MARSRPGLSRLIVLLIALAGATALAADQWIEVKSPHFTVTSNASRSSAASIAWQLEQIRVAVAALWPWAHVDLNKPLVVLALENESTMKAFAPGYWEARGSVHPTSLWVTGLDQHYMAIRTDVPQASEHYVNPYTTSFFSYVSLILDQSLEHDLPLWCSRGLSGVLSNTLTYPSKMVVGAPIPWHLEKIRRGPRLPIRELLKVTRSSGEFRNEEGLQRFDAQTWALVHFLMFGEKGLRAEKLNRFVTAVARGDDADAAFVQELGRPEALEGPLGVYVSRNLFTGREMKVDLSVKRDAFTVRPLSVGESAGARALFATALHRPNEARAAIAQARKADPSAPATYVAEGLLLDREDKEEEARAAYDRALEAGSTSSYAAYRLANLLWRGDPDRQTLERIEKLLLQAAGANPRNAAAYARLGEVRSILGTGEPFPLVSRAIALEPSEAFYHLVAARVLWRQQKWDEAAGHAQTAAALARSDDNKRAAQEMIASLAKARNRSAAAAAEKAASREATEVDALGARCQSGDTAACAAALPLLEAQCAKGDTRACGNAAWLYDSGRGVTADPAHAAELYRKACEAGERLGCVAFAGLQGRGRGVPRDARSAIATLDPFCKDGVFEACTALAVVVASGQPPDFGRARELLTRSCEAKYERACELLKSLPK